MNTKIHFRLLALLPFFCLMAMTLIISCADTSMYQMEMEQPNSLAEYEYLKDYSFVKDYTSIPIGVKIEDNDFLDGGMPYRIAVANFTEIDLGDAFCHSKLMKVSGSLDTTNLINLMEKASQNNIKIIGTTFFSDTLQNTVYLNSQLLPNVIRPEDDPGGYCICMTNTAKASANTDEQVAYTFAKTPSVEPGIKYKMTFKVRGTNTGQVQCSTYSSGKGSKFTPVFDVTTSWQEVSMTNTISSGIKGLTSILFNLGSYVGTLYVDDITFVEVDDYGYEVSDNLNTVNFDLEDYETAEASVAVHNDANGTIEDVRVSQQGEGYDPLATYIDKTDEEKNMIVENMMNQYVDDVIRLTSENISDWYVVSNPLTLNPPYEPRNSSNTDNSGDLFFWQDYIGNAWIAKVFKRIRQNTSGVKLYLSEQNLYDNSEKLSTLISLIDNIEEQDATVDGIAVQLFVDIETCDMSKIEELFDVLGNTGKLIRVYDLTANITLGEEDTAPTEEQLQLQAEIIGKIITTYRNSIPQEQQAGITLGAFIDNQDFNGLWDASYSRKHAYGAVCDALGN